LFGFTGAALISGVVAPAPGRTDPESPRTWDVHPLLDVDGDGRADALTDGC
jgi:hypothetical protein